VLVFGILGTRARFWNCGNQIPMKYLGWRFESGAWMGGGGEKEREERLRNMTGMWIRK
jgi:hypothetical protein